MSRRYWVGGSNGHWVGYFGNIWLTAKEASRLMWRSVKGEMYPWRNREWFNNVDYLRFKDSHFEK